MIELQPTTEYGALANPLASCVKGLAGFIWVPYEQPCWHCRQPTTWIDLDFEAALHPGECSETKWDEYTWDTLFVKLRETTARLRGQQLGDPPCE